MKRVLIALVLTFALTAGAFAQIKSFSDFANWGQVSAPPPTLNYYVPSLSHFHFTLGPNTGWQSIQIGRTWGVNGWYGDDWTGYTEFKLIVDNCSGCTRNIMANIWFNTGWVPGEPDNFYQNGWTWLLPGEFKTLTIDLTSVANLNHVTSYGVMFGTNAVAPTDPLMSDPYYAATGQQLIGSVHPIPEPGALLLLGSGLVGFGVIARIRRKRS